MKKPETGGAFLEAALILFVSALIETLLANFVFFAYVAGANEVSDFTSENPKFVVSEYKNGFLVDGLSFPLNSISFRVRAEGRGAPELEWINFYVYDGSDPEGRPVKRDRIAVGGDERRVTAYLSSAGNAESVEVRISGETLREAEFSSITVNPRYRFDFNFERFCAIITLFAALYVLGTNAVRERLKKTTFVSAGAAAVCVCVACASAIWILCASGENLKNIPYPLEEDVFCYSPYVQQLDAFMKGRVSLDVEPSPELLALENPYDPESRAETVYLFDRALYEGKYFSYFGIAPILLVYFPTLLIFGVLPPDSAVAGVFGVLTAIFLPLAVIELAKISKRKISPNIAAVCAVGAYFASAAPVIQRGFAPFYYIASAAGAAFASAFAFFTVGALNKKRVGARVAFFALGGISFALGFLSRINSVVPAVVAAAVFVAVYAVKSFKNKRLPRFFADAAALALPAAAALAFSLYYNELRFGDPFQFGAKYQLTVADVSRYKLSADGIPPSIFYYFLQPFKPGGRFPYLEISNVPLRPDGPSAYIDSNFGLFAFPFMWALLLSPFVFKDKKTPAENKILLGASIFSLFLTAFLDFCLGGVVFRYIYDISIFAALVCAVVLTNRYSALSEKGRGRAAKNGIIIAVAATAAASLAFAVSDNPNLAPYSPKIYASLADFFDFWNGGAL